MNGAQGEEQKTAVIKILAIVGFIATLVFVAWLAVQAVRLAPTVFTTFVSVARGLKQSQESEKNQTPVASDTTKTLKTSTVGIPHGTSTDMNTSRPADTAPMTKVTASSTKPTLTYKTVPIVVTTMPVSNPAGSSDLAVMFIGVGTYNTDTKKFVARSSLTGGERAALQFEVKNIGTKTSGDWYFSVNLPTTPTFTYSSPTEAELKPNERQVVTLQFTAPRGGSTQFVTAAVTGGNDTAMTNNYFSRQITISH